MGVCASTEDLGDTADVHAGALADSSDDDDFDSIGFVDRDPEKEISERKSRLRQSFMIESKKNPGMFGGMSMDDYEDKAHSLKEEGKFTECGPMFEKLLSFILTYDKDIDTVATAYTDCGDCLMEGPEPDLEKACAYYEKACDFQKSKYGPQSMQLATACATLAVCLNKKGDKQGALTNYRAQLVILTQELGGDHPLTEMAQQNVTAMSIN
jgi:hypothetical protein